MIADLSTRPYHALRHPEFRRIWISQLVSQTGSQMQSVALHWHVYLLTGSPLALGFVGLTRALPTILFSLWGGVVADRRDRRHVMFAAQSVMTVGALALAGLTVSHRETLLALYLLNALGAAAGAFDNPSRQALIPRLVPVADLPGALALNLAMFQTAQIAGPALAGLLIAGGTHGLLAGSAPVASGAAVGPLAADRELLLRGPFPRWGRMDAARQRAIDSHERPGICWTCGHKCEHHGHGSRGF